MTELQTKRLQPSSSSSALARSLFFLMMMSYWMLLSYLKISPSALSPVPIFGSSVLMTDFAVRRFLVFHNLFPIFIPKKVYFWHTNAHATDFINYYASRLYNDLGYF